MNTTALTPALSPRRGRTIRRLFRDPERGDCNKNLEQTRRARLPSPLPGGEGQGEGERQK